jgi:hypothetical protein
MFDPTQPATNSALSSAVMRSQLTSLKALIDAISAINSAQIDGVTTLPAGDPASVTIDVTGNTLHFTFGIPQGVAGEAGPLGPPGPPFADAVVDGVTTLPAGDPAAVSVSFDGSLVHFTFSIPSGAEGAQGPPGEVTSSELSTAISTTALNPNSVSPLSQTALSYYDETQMQAVMNKLDELLAALTRV